MPFSDISCQVWAIDGYTDDDTAKSVNIEYTAWGNRQKAPSFRERFAAIEKLVKEVRNLAKATLTKNEITVYGGYRGKQATPEHMWIEYDGKIYETMPGYELHVAKATAATRKCPPLENEKFTEDGVASYRTFLTERQKSYLDLCAAGKAELIQK